MMAAVLIALVACSARAAKQPAPPTLDAAGLATALASASPDLGRTAVTGRVISLRPGGAVVDSAGHQVDISLSTADVWKETSVPATAITVGDDLFATGGGSPFVARQVWANIGRIDGVVRQVATSDMMVDVLMRSGDRVLTRVEFSQYIEYGPPDGTVKLSKADLVPGRAISAVVYLPRGGTPRATRIW